MQSHWQSFLESNTNNANNNATENAKNILVDLSHFGLISITGADAADFLQNQFSNDVKEVTVNKTQLNSYSSAKGRLFSIFRLFLRDKTFYMRLPASQIEFLVKRLSMFVLMSKVKLQDAGEDLIRFGLAGENAESILQKHVDEVPENIDECAHNHPFSIIKLPGITPRYEIYGELEAMQKLWLACAEDAQPADADAWALLDIRSGIPTIYPETSEEFVAQMTNLQQVNGLNFKKGCFPGQEIVARMQYLGKLKRRMYRIQFSSDTAFAAGTDIFLAEGSNTQSIGKLVDSRYNETGDMEGLAVIQIENANEGNLHVDNAQGPAITILDLPYTI